METLPWSFQPFKMVESLRIMGTFLRSGISCHSPYFSNHRIGKNSEENCSDLKHPNHRERFWRFRYSMTKILPLLSRARRIVGNSRCHWILSRARKVVAIPNWVSLPLPHSEPGIELKDIVPAGKRLLLTAGRLHPQTNNDSPNWGLSPLAMPLCQ